MTSVWWRRAVVVSATALTLSPAPGFTQGAPPPTVRAHRVTDPIRLDGRLDEPVYAATPAITELRPAGAGRVQAGHREDRGVDLLR